MESSWWTLLTQKPASTYIENPTFMKKDENFNSSICPGYMLPITDLFFDKFPCFLDQKFEISFLLLNFTKLWGKNKSTYLKIIVLRNLFGGGAEGAVWGWISVPHKRQVIHYFWQPCLLPKAPSSFPPSLNRFYLPPYTPPSRPQRTIWNRTSYLQLGRSLQILECDLSLGKHDLGKNKIYNWLGASHWTTSPKDIYIYIRNQDWG